MRRNSVISRTALRLLVPVAISVASCSRTSPSGPPAPPALDHRAHAQTRQPAERVRAAPLLCLATSADLAQLRLRILGGAPEDFDRLLPDLSVLTLREDELERLVLVLVDAPDTVIPSLLRHVADGPDRAAAFALISILISRGATGRQDAAICDTISALAERPDPEQRRYATTLARLVGPAGSSASSAIVALLRRAENPEERRAVLVALSRITDGRPEVVAALANVLRGDDEEAAEVALLTISRNPGNPELWLDAAMSLLRSDDAQVQRASASLLARLPELPPRERQAVILAARNSTDPIVLTHIAEALSRDRNPVNDTCAVLLELMENPNDSVRFQAANSLLSLTPTSRSAGDCFVAALASDSPMARNAAVQGLRSDSARSSPYIKDAVLHLFNASAGAAKASALRVLFGSFEHDRDALSSELLPLLADPTPDVRYAALSVLQEAGAPVDQRILHRLVVDHDPSIRQLAAIMLAPFEPEAGAVRSALRGALESEDVSIIALALRELGKMNVPPIDLAQSIAALLSRPETRLHAAASQVVSRMGDVGARALLHQCSRDASSLDVLRTWSHDLSFEAVPSLAAAMGNENPTVRVAALRLLGRASPEALAVSRSALSDEASDVRLEALRNLNALVDPPTQSELAPLAATLLRDPDDRVRVKAAELLWRCSGPPGRSDRIVIDVMASMELKSATPDLAQCCAEAVAVMGPHAADAVPFLARALYREYPSAVFVDCIEALTAIGEAAGKAVPALVSAVEDRLYRPWGASDADRVKVRIGAATALGRIGSAAAAALPALRDAERSDDESLRDAAMTALASITRPR